MGNPLDKQSLDQLVVEHLAVMMRLATRLTGSVDRAEDLTQETLLRIARSWSSFRGEADFRTWAFRIVINVLREQERRDRPELQLAVDTIGNREPTPEQACVEEELRGIVANAVSNLPPRQREVLVLVTYEGFSASEVAEVLEIELSNVYANLSLARQRLESVLSRYVESG
jgi:RNA polymerase sigma-70 factor (ECF subfamily)